MRHRRGRAPLAEEEVAKRGLRVPVGRLGLDRLAEGALGVGVVLASLERLAQADVAVGVFGVGADQLAVERGGLLIAAADQVEVRQGQGDLTQRVIQLQRLPAGLLGLRDQLRVARRVIAGRKALAQAGVGEREARVQGERAPEVVLRLFEFRVARVPAQHGKARKVGIERVDLRGRGLRAPLRQLVREHQPAACR